MTNEKTSDIIMTSIYKSHPWKETNLLQISSIFLFVVLPRASTSPVPHIRRDQELLVAENRRLESMSLTFDASMEGGPVDAAAGCHGGNFRRMQKLRVRNSPL